MEDSNAIPLPTVVTTQPTPNVDTPDSPDDSSAPLNQTQEEMEKEKRRHRDDCCYSPNDCIWDEGDWLDFFCLCRCIGHIFQSMGHCIGSCCNDCGECFGECCTSCGETFCHGCCEAGGDVTDAADGGDCNCGDGECDCGDCNCDCL